MLYRINMVKIAFHDNQLCERGTTVAIYDYAYYNKHYLGNESIIMYYGSDHRNKQPIIEKFQKEFKLCPYENWQRDADKILEEEKCDILYGIKAGENDGKLSKVCKNVVHCVFYCNQPHGHIYSSIAPWVHGNNGQFPSVPHMINLPRHDRNMRKELSIPEDAVVFGGYGGKENFNIKEAIDAVYHVASNNPNIYFLFANFNKFCPELPNIIHLPMVTDLDKKVEFINTTDAMMWGRSGGEVMSIAMGEFAVLNKPIICTRRGTPGHVHLLKDTAIWYNGKDHLINILTNFDPSVESKKDWNAYKQYTPENVMDVFKKVYIEPLMK